jgi:hypothetical protein
MLAQVEYPVVTMAIDAVTDWWKHRSRNDLQSLPRSEVGRIAADLGMSETELRRLDREPDRPLLLLRMLDVLDLDKTAIKRNDPLVFRDLERSCAVCACKKRCTRELANGTARAHFEEFCSNAPTLKALS